MLTNRCLGVWRDAIELVLQYLLDRVVLTKLLAKQAGDALIGNLVARVANEFEIERSD
jgi:hypothetical protein